MLGTPPGNLLDKLWVGITLLGTVTLALDDTKAQEWPPKKTGPITSLGKVDGDTLLAIEAAKPELAKWNFNISDYNIEVGKMGYFIFVTLEDKIIRSECMNSSRCRGSRGFKRSFSVILAKEDLRVIKGHFVR